MKTLTQKIGTPLVAAVLMFGASLFAPAQNAMQNNTIVKEAAQDWNTPPAGTEQAKQGYKDGIEAAKLDTMVKRKIDAKASHLYAHPPVKGNDAVNQYRQSFEAGYNTALAHTAAS
ncbi:MAG TPA: hypothetical protein VII58_05200 [Acidobacteriaceae bacterium]